MVTEAIYELYHDPIFLDNLEKSYENYKNENFKIHDPFLAEYESISATQYKYLTL